MHDMCGVRLPTFPLVTVPVVRLVLSMIIPITKWERELSEFISEIIRHNDVVT